MKHLERNKHWYFAVTAFLLGWAVCLQIPRSYTDNYSWCEFSRDGESSYADPSGCWLALEDNTRILVRVAGYGADTLTRIEILDEEKP